MPGQVNAIPDQSMDATERVLPVVIGHVIEHVIKKSSGCAKSDRIEIGGVGKTDLGHLSIIARQIAVCDLWPREPSPVGSGSASIPTRLRIPAEASPP
jgi:hypothetical protein